MGELTDSLNFELTLSGGSATKLLNSLSDFPGEDQFMTLKSLHEKAQALVSEYLDREIELVNLLQEIERERVFVFMGYSSMHQYCVRGLGLSDAQAYTLIGVARTCSKVPEFKEAVETGRVKVSSAIKIVSTIKRCPGETVEWLDKAEKMSQKALQIEVSKNDPNQTKAEFKFAFSHEYSAKLARCREIMNQKNGSFVSLEEAQEMLIDLFLEEKDEVKAANDKDELLSIIVLETKTIPARIKREVLRRDRGQCQFRLPDNTLCGTPFWTEVHHIIPKSEGGSHCPSNLVTLCKAHHQREHLSA